MITTPADAAAKTGRAMELSSPVASLVPSLVLNAVMTFEGLLFGSRRSRLEECPFCATRAVVFRQLREDDGQKA